MLIYITPEILFDIEDTHYYLLLPLTTSKSKSPASPTSMVIGFKRCLELIAVASVSIDTLCTRYVCNNQTIPLHKYKHQHCCTHIEFVVKDDDQHDALTTRNQCRRRKVGPPSLHRVASIQTSALMHST